jgi:hypothetical protein
MCTSSNISFLILNSFYVITTKLGLCYAMSSETDAQKAEQLFSLASTLDHNFYEDCLPPETVMDHAEAVKELVLKRKRIL